MESTDEKVNSHVHAYKRARQGMVILGADEDIMQRFKDITPEDIKVSKDIMEEQDGIKGMRCCLGFGEVGRLMRSRGTVSG